MVLVRGILWQVVFRVWLISLIIAQLVKNSPAVQQTLVWFLGQEVPLPEGMATHSSNLAWIILWTEEPGGLQSTGSQRVRHDWATKHSTACVTQVYTDCYATTCPANNKGNTVSVFNLEKRKLEWCKGHGAGRKGIRLQNEMAEWGSMDRNG